MQYFYRFRSIDALIGDRRELEKQEIYFAHPDELNDPMEGFKDLLWRGDRIVWMNLIKNYLLSIQLALTIAYLTGDDYLESNFPVTVFASDSTLPTPKSQEIHRNICRSFFDDPDVAAIPELLASQNRPIRREELSFYLRAMHGRAICCVVEGQRAAGLFPAGDVAPPAPLEVTKAASLAEMLRTLNKHKNDGEPENGIDIQMFISSSHLFRQIELQNYFQADTPKKRMWQMICLGYPERYVQHLNDVIYSDWYAACFVVNPHDAAMWGNYGAGHKGVCLKFRSTEGEGGSSYLNLKRIVGRSFGPSGTTRNYGTVPHRFMKINYVDKFVEIDFFRSMGRMQTGALHKDWYRDENGRISSCADEIFSNEDEWRKRYWATFEATVTTKFRDWNHEDEYRLILNAMLGGFEDPADRKLVYDFKDLAGIVFGINTTLDDRMRVCQVILDKCKASGRTDFEFAQAYYSAQTGTIEAHSLNLLNSLSAGSSASEAEN